MAFNALPFYGQILPPVGTCDYTPLAPTYPSTTSIPINGEQIILDDPGTGAPNYTYVITDPSVIVYNDGIPLGELIIGTVEEEPIGSGIYVLNPSDYNLVEGMNYNLTGFGFDFDNINQIAAGVYVSNLCTLAVPCNTDGDSTNDFCQSCVDGPGPPDSFNTLLEFFDFAAAIGGGGIASIESVLQVVDLVDDLSDALAVPDPCYVINEFYEYSFTVIAPISDLNQATCGYNVVAPVYPTTTNVLIDETLILNDVPGTGAPNYAYVITDPSQILLNDNGDPVGELILGTVEEDPIGSGNYVLNPSNYNLIEGMTYNISGFGFDLENLNQIVAGVYTSFLCTITVPCSTDGDSSNDFCQICSDGPVPPENFTTLSEFFDFSSAINDGNIAIESVLEIVELIDVLSLAFEVPQPCYTINNVYEYSFRLGSPELNISQATCGYSVPPAYQGSVGNLLCNSNSVLVLENAPLTGAPDFAYFITDPSQIISDENGDPDGAKILGTIENSAGSNYVLDPSDYNLTGGTSYYLSGLSYDLENLNAIVSGIYESSLCSMHFPCISDTDPANDICQTCQDQPAAPANLESLQEFLDFIGLMLGPDIVMGSDLSIENVIGVFELVDALSTSLQIPVPCYSILSLNEISVVIDSALTFYEDADGDGLGNPNISITTCDSPPVCYVDNDSDLDDTDAGYCQNVAEVIVSDICIELLAKPVENEFTIIGDLGLYYIEILDENENLYENITPIGNIHTINLNDLPIGTFFIRITNINNNQIEMQKILE